MTRKPAGRGPAQSRRQRRREAAGPEPLGNALSRLIALKGLAQERGDAELERTWKEIAGERIARRTSVIALRRGVLQVAVASSAMLAELAAYHKPQLLADMQSRQPRIKLRDIKFKLQTEVTHEGS